MIRPTEILTFPAGQRHRSQRSHKAWKISFAAIKKASDPVLEKSVHGRSLSGRILVNRSVYHLSLPYRVRALWKGEPWCSVRCSKERDQWMIAILQCDIREECSKNGSKL